MNLCVVRELGRRRAEVPSRRSSFRLETPEGPEDILSPCTLPSLPIPCETSRFVAQRILPLSTRTAVGIRNVCVRLYWRAFLACRGCACRLEIRAPQAALRPIGNLLCQPTSLSLTSTYSRTPRSKPACPGKAEVAGRQTPGGACPNCAVRLPNRALCRQANRPMTIAPCSLCPLRHGPC